MKQSALDVLPLCCPFCVSEKTEEESTLSVHATSIENGDILTGFFECSSCARKYHISVGVAIFYTDSSVAGYLGESESFAQSYTQTQFRDLIISNFHEGEIKPYDLTGFFTNDQKINYYTQLIGMISPYIDEDSLVLDVGCSVGRIALELGLKAKFAYGLDPSEMRVRTARTILKTGLIPVCLGQNPNTEQEKAIYRGDIHADHFLRSKCEFFVADDSSLPFQKKTFDLVCCSSIIDRVPNIEDFLRRVDNMVSDNAILLITDPFDWNEEYSPPDRWLGRGAFHTSLGREEVALKELLFRFGYVCLQESDIPWFHLTHRRHHNVLSVYTGIYRKARQS